METVARFVTRLQGKNDGLFIGVTMKPGTFKPNTVYEIKNTLGTLTIVEVGMATGAGPDNCASTRISYETPFHWSEPIGDIIGTRGKSMFLTMQELNSEDWSKVKSWEQ
jgi:hypothetical protein